MKLSNILKSFTKAQADLSKFIDQNGKEISSLHRQLDAKQTEQYQALTVRENIGKLLGDSK